MRFFGSSNLSVCLMKRTRTKGRGARIEPHHGSYCFSHSPLQGPYFETKLWEEKSEELEGMKTERCEVDNEKKELELTPALTKKTLLVLQMCV